MDGWAYWVDCGVRSSVRKKPGSTSMVRMPNGATSGARASMNPSTPNLEAAYAVVNWTGEVMPAVEEIVITKPERWARNCGRAARVTLTGPNRVVSIWERNASGVISSKKPAWKLPALLTNTSSRPNPSTVAATATSRAVGERPVHAILALVVEGGISSQADLCGDPLTG